MTKQTDTTEKRKRNTRALIRPAIIVASAILGLGTASAAYSMVIAPGAGTTVVAQGVTASASNASPSAKASATAKPSAKPSTKASTGAAPVPGGSTSASSSKGGSTGSTGSGSSNGGTGSGSVQPPAPAPQPATWCPDSRDQNPALWDECRAGYVRPSIVYAGAVSCTINNRAAGDYTIVLGFRIVGGNYRDYWVGSGVTDSSLTYATRLQGAQPDWFVSPGDVAQISIGPMNGLPGPAIDYVDSEPSGTTTVAQACGL